MKILIIKTSSLGDIIHTLPALTDAALAIEGVRFDWVAEKGFAEIPSWHAQVDKVIPISWRKWRKNLRSSWKAKEIQHFYQELRTTQYDKVIDLQGLVKSAVISFIAKGERCGLDFQSARESLASLFYQRKHQVNFQQHAVVRTRELMAKALGYALPDSVANYGILQHFPRVDLTDKNTVIFFHGTTRDDKEWPTSHWIALAKYCAQMDLKVLLPWGNEREKQRAEEIAQAASNAEVLPKLSLTKLAQKLSQAKASLAVDTGLGHLAAALNVPTLSLYGSTDPKHIGACGENQTHLCAPGQPGKGVLSELLPEAVWQRFEEVLAVEYV
jgi:heptosyltransferase-1